MRALVLAGLLASTVAVAPGTAHAGLPDTAWKSSVTERLVRLPSASLKKALDKDFSGSPLAEALRDNESEIGLKLRTLNDLQAAIDQAKGDIQIELKHQFLAEKKAYLGLVQEQQRMRSQHLRTRVKVYQRLLRKLDRQNGAKTPGQTALLQRQSAARARLGRTADKIDAKLFATSLTSNSKYSKLYARNVTAINALLSKIDAHPHKAKLDVAGDAKNKPDFLRQLLAEAEGDLQILQQEGDIVGLMAKLVALDAMGLREEVAEGQPDAVEKTARSSVADAIELF